jgi:hypothetical protein
VLSRIFFKRQRGRRLLAALATVTLVTGLVGSAVFAANTTLVNFEIDGNLPALTTDGTSEDWVHAGNTGVDSPSSALKCANNAATCAPTVPAAGLITNVVDGSGLGSAELYRDWLKVDPDHTTFTNGDKENDYSVGSVVCPVSGACSSDTPWHIVTGSVPPNKDDLFDVATNTYISGNQSELDIGMIRTNNNGSSHVDFELNRANWTPGSTGAPACATDTTGITGFKCPKRTEGDLLISFEISPSGSGVTVATRYFVWDLPGGIDAGAGKRPTSTLGCDGPLSGNENTCPWEEISAPATTVLVAGVNPADMAAQPWGNRLPSGAVTATIPQGGWFEAGLDLDALGFPPSCPGFGTASAKSRSSGSSVTSALTDLAGPFPINLNTCGKITIIKDTVPDAAQDFHYTTTGGLTPSSFDLDDDADATLSNTQVYNQVTPGSYTVTEGGINGYVLTSLTCSATGTGSSGAQHAVGSFQADIVVGNAGDVTCTYVNTLQQGAIKIAKTAKNKNLTPPAVGDPPQSGVVFSISGHTGTVTTGNDGTACVDSLSFGNHTVTETVPTGYQADSTNPQTIDVETNATCGSGNETAATFHNTPLTTITVSTNSLAGAGVTQSQVKCAAETTLVDTPHTTTGLVPGTYTCTIVVDP